MQHLLDKKYEQASQFTKI